MEQETSLYQSLKLLLAQYVPVDRDILHVLIGFGLVLGAILIAGRSLRIGPFLLALAIASLLGAGMEFLDRQDDLRGYGVWRWHASALDFVRTIFFPLIAIIFIYVLRIRKAKP